MRYFQEFSKLGCNINFRAFASGTDWYFNEFFKFIAASKVDDGAQYTGIQHGGNYGVEKNHPLLEYETINRDMYVTWGWSEVAFPIETKIKPGPSLKLELPANKFAQKKQASGILFGASESPLYPRWVMRDDHAGAVGRLKNQMEFFKEVGFGLRAKTRFRLNTGNLGWDQVFHIAKRYPEIAIETYQIPFKKSLLSAEVYVTNILSTTYVEALVCGCPTVLILDKERDLFTDEARPYMNCLEEVGIIHYSGKNAGRFLASIEGDVLNWWNQDNTQRAVLLYTEQFLFKKVNALDFWCDLSQSLS